MTTEYLKTKQPLYIPYAGNTLLELPLLNKGSAFTEEERTRFNLHGLIPHVEESIEEKIDNFNKSQTDDIIEPAVPEVISNHVVQPIISTQSALPVNRSIASR